MNLMLKEVHEGPPVKLETLDVFQIKSQGIMIHAVRVPLDYALEYDPRVSLKGETVELDGRLVKVIGIESYAGGATVPGSRVLRDLGLMVEEI